VVALEKFVECGCGWTCRGTEERVVADCMAHGLDIHQMNLTREQVLAVAKPVDDSRSA
jgi:hypothetical protein